MKRHFLMAMILLLFAAPAAAFDWSLQARWGYGQMFPQSDEWDELYEGEDISRNTFSLDAELWKGFGPYLGYQGGRTEGKYLDKITLTFQSNDFVLGAQYRYPLADWVVPGMRLGMLFLNSRQVLDDDYIEYEMESNTVGFEIAQDWNFYFAPNAKSRFWRGWGIFGEYYYQYRPIEEMGDLEDASGWGYHLGIQYKYDFEHEPKKKVHPSDKEILEKQKELDELIKKKEEAKEKEGDTAEKPEAEDTGEASQPEPERSGE